MKNNIMEEFKDLALGYSTMFSENFETYVKPDIPEKKLKKAIKSYAQEVNQEQVVALCDLTLFGSAKVGFLITPAGFYYKESLTDPVHFTFQNLVSTEVSELDEEVKKAIFRIILVLNYN